MNRQIIMPKNIFFNTIKFVSVEIIWDVIYFPLWWYSRGLVKVGQYCLQSASFHLNRRVALGIWLRSIFKPMYGDTTWEGRAISQVMRIIILIWKLIFSVIWLVWLLIIFILWLALPVAIVWFILYQIFNVPFIIK